MKKLLLIFVVMSLFCFGESYIDKPLKVEKVYTLDYEKNATCLVRHFSISKDPKWAAKIVTKGGKSVYFSSPKSMFEFYHRPGKWFEVGVKSEKGFDQIVARDFITDKPIDAKSAFYVYGSSITSPAGDDLVVIGSKDAADKFAKEHNGKRVMKFDEVSDALIRLLNGRI